MPRIDPSALRHFAVAALVAVVTTSAACAEAHDGDDPSGAAEGPDGDRLKVALLTSGPVSDAGWYAGAWDGLMVLRDSLGAQVSHQQTRTPAEFDEAFLSYGDAGFDLVFAHGFEYQDAAIRAGGRYPDMTIVVSGGGRVARNVVPLVFTLEEGSYLAGMLAGGMTRTDRVGMVGGVAIPPARGTFLAFEVGARAVNPDVTVLEAFIGSWDDVAAAKEATVAQLRRDADVIIHNTDAASFGVFNAVREARADGREAWALGMNRDQNDVAPDAILGSAVIRIADAFLEVGRRFLRDELGGEPVYAGMSEGVVDLVVNPLHRDRVPDSLMVRIDSIRTAITEKRFEVPRVRFVEGEEGPSGS